MPDTNRASRCPEHRIEYGPARESMRRDPEIDAIRRILALLMPLPPVARARVLEYVAHRPRLAERPPDRPPEGDAARLAMNGE